VPGAAQSAGGRARRERLLARVKLVQQQLAAAAEASEGPAPAPAQLGTAARPHGLTRICSLGARAAADALALPPVDEGAAPPHAAPGATAAPHPGGLGLGSGSSLPLGLPPQQPGASGGGREPGDQPMAPAGESRADNPSRTQLAGNLMVLAMALLMQDSARQGTQ
jgi:hypothetical protein